MNLYFDNGRGEIRLVKENILFDDTSKEITQYIHKLNPKYHIYYIRCWGDDECGYTYDVGSHSEFFYFCTEDQICSRRHSRGL